MFRNSRDVAITITCFLYKYWSIIHTCITRVTITDRKIWCQDGIYPHKATMFISFPLKLPADYMTRSEMIFVTGMTPLVVPCIANEAHLIAAQDKGQSQSLGASNSI